MSNVKICLDAGHFGKYNQSSVAKSYYESEMTWKLHLLLKKYLEQYGIEVKVTRSKQANDLSLYSRGAASKGCDLFISLHSNACGTESVDRPEGIYLVDDDCGSIDGISKNIAVLLAGVVADVMKTKDSAKTYSKKSSNDRDGDGKKNDDYYGVLYGAHQVGVAGVILEHSFHTNKRAAEWLLSESNLDRLAKAEAKALAEYFSLKKTSSESSKKPVKMVIKKGSVVTLDVDAVYYNGKLIPAWVKAEKWFVKSVSGDRIVIDKSVNGKYSIDSPVNAMYLNVVDTTSSGNAVEKLYPNEKPKYAKSFATMKAGVYKVDAKSGLYLRAGADTSKKAIELLKNGSGVRCYGYYTEEWLFVVSESGKKGYCHSSYLKRV